MNKQTQNLLIISLIVSFLGGYGISLADPNYYNNQDALTYNSSNTLIFLVVSGVVSFFRKRKYLLLIAGILYIFITFPSLWALAITWVQNNISI